MVPAVVTLIGNSAARIVIEDVPDDEDGHFILREDVRWARKKKEDGTLAQRPRSLAICSNWVMLSCP